MDRFNIKNKLIKMVIPQSYGFEAFLMPIVEMGTIYGWKIVNNSFCNMNIQMMHQF